MPLIIEDGTTPSPAGNSYITIAEVRAYWEDRADDIFVAGSPEVPTDAIVTAAILRAADYMRQSWRLLWEGSRTQAFQSMDWPRTGVFIPDFFDPYFRDANVPFAFRNTLFFSAATIPQEVKNAQIMLTRAALASATEVVDLNEDLGRVTAREKLGELEVEYAIGSQSGAGGGARQQTIYKDALGEVEPFMRPNSAGSSMRG